MSDESTTDRKSEKYENGIASRFLTFGDLTLPKRAG